MRVKQFKKMVSALGYQHYGYTEDQYNVSADCVALSGSRRFLDFCKRDSYIVAKVEKIGPDFWVQLGKDRFQVNNWSEGYVKIIGFLVENKGFEVTVA
jgi:hypothetical protein